MCLILFSNHQHPQSPLIFLSNWDEYDARPNTPASFWDDHPFLLVGKDLQKAGTTLIFYFQ